MFWKQRNSDQKAINAIFLWLNNIATERDIILVDSSGRKEFFYFDFPLRYGDRPRRTKTLLVGREITFIIRKPRGGEFSAEGEWVTIFSSPEWKIFEKKTRQFQIPPFRWGLNEEEKTVALKIARDALEKFLTDGQQLEQIYLKGLPSRFYLKTDLDVAIWVEGRLRGSAVLENFHFGEGIAEAVIRASRDKRFKPLSKEELETARIEITIVENPFIPVSFKELKKNEIYPDKGYLLRKGKQKGWFLPEVFNVRRFSNLQEFLAELGHTKAGLARESYKNSDIFIFEVDDFIESEDRSSPIDLFGPIAKKEKSSACNLEFVTQKMRLAADWLCRIQESDGNMPPIINPLNGHQTQIDWPRLAFTAWALAEFGKAAHESKYLFAAEKSFEYLKNYLISNSRFLVPNYELTLVYFGRLSLALGKSNDAAVAVKKIFERIDNLSFEPILFAQIASFLKALPDSKEKYSKTFENICRMLRSTFEKNRQDNIPMNLAVWAEMVAVFSSAELSFSEQIGGWLKKQQLPNGAFPESTISDFVYTRGSGKIFEVLALEPEKNKEAIEKALDWLFSMQYNTENTFFVPEEIRSRIIGGFRHDHFNQEAWIDAAGHILLGAAGLIRNKVDKE